MHTRDSPPSSDSVVSTGLMCSAWRTLSESTFAMLDSSGLKTTFWEYAIQTAAFLWLEAIKEELSAHAARQTWEATLLPAGRKAIGTKWVFKTKVGPGPNDFRKKARLVVKGFSQKYGVDYEETFAPTVCKSTIRAAISFAVSEGWVIEQVDVDTAFLYATLKEEIYMALPEGIHLISTSSCSPSPDLLAHSKETGQPVAARLIRALYGLKQAPKEWREELNRILGTLHFYPCVCDPGAYLKTVHGRMSCILLVYVDDILIICPSSTS